MGSIGRLINQLEGTKKFKQNYGSQYMFQPGTTSLISPDKLLSVNNPDYIRTILLDQTFTGALSGGTNLNPTVGKTVYKWGEKTVATLQNHTHQPVYVTFKYISPRMNLLGLDNSSPGFSKRLEPENKVTHISTNQSCSNEAQKEQSFKFESDVNKLTYSGFLESGQNDFSTKLITGMQGIYDNKSSALSYGEGLGSLGSLNTAVPFSEVAKRTAGNDDVSAAVLCTPIGTSYNHSEFFRSMFKVYELKRIVIMPEQAHTFTLSDSSLMWIEDKADISGSILDGVANPDHHYLSDPWMKRNCWNRYTKLCVMEVNGSLIGADMIDAPEAVDTDGQVNDYSFGTTKNDVKDNVNILTPAAICTTHGGVLRLFVQKEFYAGQLPNEDREETYFHLQNEAKLIGAHDEALTVRTDAAQV